VSDPERPGPDTGSLPVLLELSAALAAREPGAVERALSAARDRADARAVEEVILQSYLFLGYPAALNAFALWRDLTGRDGPEPAPEDWEAWSARGRRVCGAVYGDQYGRLRENVRRLHPDMERWMVIEGYGKVLGRPGLSLTERELCIAALLAVLGAPVQLYSHLRGALNVGASPAQVEEALDAASGYMDEGARTEARATWDRVRGRAGER